MRNFVRSILVSAFLPALLLLSCGRSRPEEPLPELVMPVIQVDSAKCHEFAKEVERSFALGDGEFLSQSVNVEMCWDRVAYGMKVSDRDKLDFINKLPAGFGITHRYGEIAEQGGSFRFLRIRWDDGRPRALFRLDVPEEGFTYFDFLLGDRAGAEVVVYDVFLYSIGELFSTTTRRVMAKSQGNILKELVGRGTVKAYVAIDSLKWLTKEEDYEGVIAYSDNLPPSLRKDRLVQTLRVGAAMNLPPVQYEHVIAEFQELFSGDPSANLMLIGQYELLGKYDSALAAIDRLDAAVEGDPYLNESRASILTKARRFDEARRAIAVLSNLDPTSSDPTMMLFDVALAEKNYNEVVRLMDVLTAEWGMEWSIESLESKEMFAGLAASPAYARWKERYRPGKLRE